MTDRKMCPNCFLWLDDPIHEPCPETDEGRSLDEQIRAAHIEREIEEGLHDYDDRPLSRLRAALWWPSGPARPDSDSIEDWLDQLHASGPVFEDGSDQLGPVPVGGLVQLGEDRIRDANLDRRACPGPASASQVVGH